MSAVVTFGGWVAAGVAGLVALVVWRLLGVRMESVARASHELRGPLTAARLGLELGARMEALSPQRFRAVDLELARAALALDDLALAGNARLAGLAGNGRPTARHINHTHAARSTPTVQLRELVSDSVEARRASADAASARLRLHWVGPDARVRGDRVRLAQATDNLIANAIEHGGKAIDVYGRAERGKVHVEVVDNGPGLPAPISELIRRARGGRGRQGRGLAIATAIVHDHGGRLIAAPAHRGSRLVVELPLTRGGSERPAG